MKKYALLILLVSLLFWGCDDDDSPEAFTVTVHELQGITIHLNSGDVKINLDESYESVMSKLPDVGTVSTYSFDFFQINFEFSGGTFDPLKAPLGTITIFNPEKSWFYTDAYKMESFETDSGVSLETATKTGVQAVYGVGDESDDSVDEYDSLHLKFRYDDGAFYYLAVRN